MVSGATCACGCGSPVAHRFVRGHNNFIRPTAWVSEDRGYETPCHIWQRALNPDGYGREQRDGKSRGAHVWAWTDAHGPIAGGLHVCHHCDQPACVNPMHLFLGTPAQNVADCAAKGRQYRGSRHHLAKLTMTDARRIRAMVAAGASPLEAATRHGVARTTVYAVLQGRTWAER